MLHIVYGIIGIEIFIALLLIFRDMFQEFDNWRDIKKIEKLDFIDSQTELKTRVK